MPNNLNKRESETLAAQDSLPYITQKGREILVPFGAENGDRVLTPLISNDESMDIMEWDVDFIVGRTNSTMQ